jgi:hypothetical protein
MEPNEERQENDKKAERLAKRRERRRPNVCSRRLLRKEKLVWENAERHGKKDC